MTTTAAEDHTQRSKAAACALAALVIACALLLLFYRNDRLFVAPEFWAEDIHIYFAQDRLFGASAFLMPWNGFIQSICRLFAWMAGFAPAEYGPRLYASLFVLSFTATVVIVYTSPAWSGPWKALATLALVAAPVGSEVFFGMCYTPWIIGPLVGLALYERPAGPRRSAPLLAAFAIIGLSSPFVLIATPLTALKAFTERSRHAYALCALTILSALVHAAPILARFTRGASGGYGEVKIDAVLSMLYRWAIGDSTSMPRTVVVLVSLLTIALVGLLVRANRPVAVRPAIYLFGTGALVLVVSCASIEAPMLSHPYGNFARYFYIPSVLVLWALVAIEQSGRRRPWVALLLGAVMAGPFVAYTDRAGEQYRDAHWDEVARCLKTETQCRADANPAFLGNRPVPTDAQVKTLTADERRAFKSALENAFPR